MTIKSKLKYAWAYLTGKMAVTVKEKQTGAEKTFLWNDLPDDIQEAISLYGIGKVLQDRNSQVPAEQKMEAFDRTWEQLCNGIWKAERQVGARFLPAVIEVIAKRKDCSVAAAQAAYRALDEDQRTVLKSKLSKQIQEVEAARAAQTEVDLDDLI